MEKPHIRHKNHKYYNATRLWFIT